MDGAGPDNPGRHGNGTARHDTTTAQHNNGTARRSPGRRSGPVRPGENRVAGVRHLLSGNADVAASTHSAGSADVTDGAGVTTGAGTSSGAVGAVDLDACYRLPPLAAGQVHVRSNFVSSVDGATEVDGRSGALGGSADRRVFRLLRWLADVVLVGAGTVVAEDYGPVIVPPDRRERRVAAGQDAVPPVAVVSAALRLDPSARLFAAPVRPLVLTCEAAPPARRKALAEVADVLVCGERRVDTAVALRALGERGLGRVLCEGGPSLHADLADAGLLDELCVTIAPLLAGPDHLRMVRGRRWQAPLTMTLSQVLEEDGNLFLRYLRR